MSGRKKSFWSDEETREICAQTTTPGMSVARRYAVNANLIFKWLKYPQFASAAVEPVDDIVFLSVEIESNVVHESVSPAAPPPPSSAPLFANCVDITLSDGRRILVE